MSAKIVGAVWDLDLPMTEKMILLAMADHADHEGENVFPSTALVAYKCQCSERTVMRVRQRLVDQKILVEVERAPGRSVVYRIDTAAGKRRKRAAEANSTPDRKSPLTESHPCQSSVRGGVTKLCQGRGDKALSPITVKEPSGNRQKKDSGEDLPDIPEQLRTVEFLQVWPRWVEYRKATGRKPKSLANALRLHLQRLVLYPPEVAVEAIRRSIENQWTGLFPESVKQKVSKAATAFKVVGSDSKTEDLNAWGDDDSALQAAASK